jgi:hypothetical protein
VLWICKGPQGLQESVRVHRGLQVPQQDVRESSGLGGIGSAEGGECAYPQKKLDFLLCLQNKQLVSCESLCLLEIQAKLRTNFLRKVETRIAFLHAIRSLARILRRHKLSQPIKYLI